MQDMPETDAHLLSTDQLFDVEHTRRRLFALLGGGAVAAAASGVALSRWSRVAAAATTTTGESCSVIPEETAGPYPGDGSNGPNVLDDDGIVRSDITASYGTSTTVAEGVPLTIELVITDTSMSCGPLEGAAVYAWHCDREGRYSIYSSGVENENYLRGVQPTAADGLASFTSIFPGCYSGRWPHVHFEVYRSVADAVAGTGLLATSQIAFPQDVCDEVYATEGYEQSVSNLARLSLASDNVFGDDEGAHQLATMTGSVEDGYVARLDVGI
jgi:protocatechuate 3,4-dioxygenase beta subunit